LSPLIPKPRTRRGALVELIIIAGVAIGLALLIQAFIVKPYRIPSGSMEPTLDIGQRILVDRVSNHFSDPDVGDIVVFHPPEGAVGGSECGITLRGRQPSDVGEACPQPVDQESDVNFIKRIVAGPGDRLSIRDGHPVVNGVMAKESFIEPCNPATASVPCNLRRTIVIPPSEYFMMGDNRGHSDDSRIWGPVPRDWIIGDAFLTYWPPDRIGFP
jgi:signal peptidase I